MYTLEEVKEKLKFYNLKAVSSETGIPYMTLWRAVRRDLPVNYEVVKKLSDFLTQQV